MVDQAIIEGGGTEDFVDGKVVGEITSKILIEMVAVDSLPQQPRAGTGIFHLSQKVNRVNTPPTVTAIGQPQHRGQLPLQARENFEGPSPEEVGEQAQHLNVPLVAQSCPAAEELKSCVHQLGFVCLIRPGPSELSQLLGRHLREYASDLRIRGIDEPDAQKCLP